MRSARGGPPARSPPGLLTGPRVCWPGMARVGILTGGGDCPGLNAVIRAIVRRAETEGGGWSCVGFRRGWAGVLEGDSFALARPSTVGILARGGTILGTSRTNPFSGGVDRSEQIREVLAAGAGARRA